MAFYAVRTKDDHEAVGLFSAESLKILWWLTDQVCDPGLCQYKQLINCGIVWADPTGWKFPEFETGDDEDDKPIFVGASMDDALWNYLNIKDEESPDLGWRDFPCFSMSLLDAG